MTQTVLIIFIFMTTVACVGLQVVNRRIEAENARLRGKFEAEMRVLAALSSDTEERIESVTIQRCEHCPHCAEVTK